MGWIKEPNQIPSRRFLSTNKPLLILERTELIIREASKISRSFVHLRGVQNPVLVSHVCSHLFHHFRRDCTFCHLERHSNSEHASRGRRQTSLCSMGTIEGGNLEGTNVDHLFR